ncbi:hypothetical protein D3C78_1508800 [compost metagenome]
MHTVAVDQPGVSVGQVAVVDLVGVFRQLDAFDFLLAGGVEQAQFDLGGVGREQREVDPQAIPGCPQGEGQAFANARRLGGWCRSGLAFVLAVLLALVRSSTHGGSFFCAGRHNPPPWAAGG